jgi:hypothetical protein
MAKVHELLAVETSLKSQAEKTRSDLLHTFEKKRHLFAEKIVTFIPKDETEPRVTEDQSSLQSTIQKELDWLTGIWSKALDVSYQIANANTESSADVELEDGTVLLYNLPATALLELEKRVVEMKSVVDNIPTLDPAKSFTLDMDRGKGIYRAKEDVKIRTKKVQEHVVVVQPTPQHPAQVAVVSRDIPVGNVQTQEWSGLITPAEKSEMIDRVEKLGRAIKAARARANTTEVSISKRIGETLLNYVFSNR